MLHKVHRIVERKARAQVLGFTLIELLVTVVLLAVVTAIAVPGLGQFVTNSRLRATQSEFVSALTLARSEATKRGGDVAISARGAVNDAEFVGGWLVCSDTDLNGVCDAGEPIIRQYDALQGQTRFKAVVGTTTTKVTSAAFNSRGFLNGPALNFTICGPVGTIKSYRIRLEPVGIADVVEAEDSCV